MEMFLNFIGGLIEFVMIGIVFIVIVLAVCHR
jgi:hypothetical protein